MMRHLALFTQTFDSVEEINDMTYLRESPCQPYHNKLLSTSGIEYLYVHLVSYDGLQGLIIIFIQDLL